MNYQHKNLAAGRWRGLTFFEQMGNIGSEVHRALTWREKENEEYARLALDRSLELIHLTIKDPKNHIAGRLKELALAKEFWTDFFLFENKYHFTADWWRNYFNAFAMAARRDR